VEAAEVFFEITAVFINSEYDSSDKAETDSSEYIRNCFLPVKAVVPHAARPNPRSSAMNAF
jgi:hypothetical protein